MTSEMSRVGRPRDLPRERQRRFDVADQTHSWRAERHASIRLEPRIAP